MPKNLRKVIKTALILSIFGVAIVFRFTLFSEEGGDFGTFLKAVKDFETGKNPYEYTIQTFEDTNLGNQGYAYFPVLLYIFTLLELAHRWLLSSIPLFSLWKIPIVVGDVGVAILLYKILSNKSFSLTLFALVCWFFNPYLMLTHNYTSLDSVVILFLLLSIYFFEKHEKLATVFFGLSIMTKVFPIILLPLFFLLAKKKLSFTLTCLGVFLLVSLPFLSDINTYLRGSVFVNSDRFVQGRPFLQYFSYKFSLDFIRVLPFELYSLASIASGWLLTVVFYLRKKITGLTTFLILPFLSFYFFTPVLNKTYLVWAIPILFISLSGAMFKKRPVLVYVLILAYLTFYSYYLIFWTSGLQYGFRG